MQQIRVRAGAGLRVPMPGGKVIDESAPSEGVLVELDLFVRKCLECGDLVEVEAPAATPVAPSKPTPTAAADTPAPSASPAPTAAKES